MSRRRRFQLSETALALARENPFGPEVLGDDFVVCLECGRRFRALGSHLPRKHGMSVPDYKEVYGYNRSQPLMAATLVDQFVANGKAIPRYDHVMEKLNQSRGIGPRPNAKLTKRAQAMPHLIERNRQQAQAVPKGPDSKLYRQDLSPERVAELFAQGLTKREVAATLGCHPRLLFNRMRELGLNHPARREDVTVEAVAAAYAEGDRSMKALTQRFQCGDNLIRKRLTAAGIVVPATTSTGLPPAGGKPPLGRKPRVANRPDVSPQAVAEARAQGMSWKAMTEHFGCSEATVRHRLHQAGAALAQGPAALRTDVSTEDVVAARAEGLSLQAICVRFGCSEHLVRRRLDDGGVPRTSVSARSDISAQAVAEAAATGCSLAELAAQFGCSKALISTRLQEAGLLPHGDALRHVRDVHLLAQEAAGMSPQDMARMLDCRPRSVVRRLRDAHQARTVAERSGFSLDALAALVHQGVSVARLMEAFDCGEGAVRGLLRMLAPQGSPSPRPRVLEVPRSALAALLEQGLTRVQISQQLGISLATIETRIREYGLQRSTPVKPAYQRHITPDQVVTLRASGLTLEAIGKVLGCSTLVVQKRLREAGHGPIDRRRLDVSVERVAQGHAQGLSIEAMAAAFRCGTGLIRLRLREIRPGGKYDGAEARPALEEGPEDPA